MPPERPPQPPTDEESHGLWPCHAPNEVRRVAKLFGQRNTKSLERNRILARLQASGAVAQYAAPTLMEVFDRQDVTTRHKILDLFENVLTAGGDLSEVAEILARQLNHPNFGLRKHAAEVLIGLGPMAKNGVGRVMGCTRHALPDVRLAAVRVIAAIGPEVADTALPRLRKMLQTSDSNREMIAAIAQAMGALNPGGEATDAAPPSAGEQGDSAAPQRRTSSRKVSTRRIMRKAREHAATAGDEEAVAAALTRLRELKPQKRMQALLAGLQSDNAGTRDMAARVLQEFPGEIKAFTEIFRQAYTREREAIVRDRLADLLTIIDLQ